MELRGRAPDITRMFKSTAKDIVRLGWPVLIGQLATMANGYNDT